MGNNQKNLMLAFALSLGVMLAFDYFYMRPQMEAEQARFAAQQAQEVTSLRDQASQDLMPDLTEALPEVDEITPSLPGEDALAALEEQELDVPRIAVETPNLRGSISLAGGRIDDLVLTQYMTELGPDGEPVRFFTPDLYYADFGWRVPSSLNIAAPKHGELWQSAASVLTPDQPVVLTYDNGNGLKFTRTIAVDDQFMFTIRDAVENFTDAALAVAPYGFIRRNETPDTLGFFILHEGPFGQLDGEVRTPDYSDLVDDGKIEYNSTGGWIGMTDKYWMSVLIPDQKADIKARFLYDSPNGTDRYQTDYRLDAQVVLPGARYEFTHRLFAGAKKVSAIDDYGDSLGITNFYKTIDWGWFEIFTRPIFFALSYLFELSGNFGIAILLLTLAIKAALFPLANKQYRSMSKMKKIQPKFKELQERYKDDKPQLQQKMMELYKTEKVNPAGGCLPVLVQIPIFFALYKTLFVTIDMRHQPFFGWVQDLSAPDPMWFTNMFGLLPFDPPSFLQIGIWPILMGVSMWLQQKMNPAPPDPMQAKIMSFLPIIFTFILAPFAVGLVIYWTFNNILSITQQWVIMRKEGVSISDDKN